MKVLWHPEQVIGLACPPIQFGNKTLICFRHVGIRFDRGGRLFIGSLLIPRSVTFRVHVISQCRMCYICLRDAFYVESIRQKATGYADGLKLELLIKVPLDLKLCDKYRHGRVTETRLRRFFIQGGG
jgi:hypothetical protein